MRKINDGARKEDIAASIFQAVVNQTISGLAAGHKISGNVAFLGGPLYFMDQLRQRFIKTLHLTDERKRVIFGLNGGTKLGGSLRRTQEDGVAVGLGRRT